ncbi:MAG: bifunctional DNA primase/polymerase [Actinomycetota bacterium]|nr:bifunctional DNA primase/polymerase [Actinomycetota bacterium]
MSELLDAALDYARRGWPVFPLVPKGKLPVIPSAHERGEPPCRAECGREGHGLYDATTDEATIRRWWGHWPRANIGVRTGVAFDVVDIDGQEALDALNAYRSGGPITWGPEVVTGGRGWHLWHLPSGAGNRAGLLGAHIDYRGAGGYVVAPPSVHPSGERYVWAADIGAGPDEPLEPLPAWLHELVLPPRPVAHPSSAQIAPARLDAYGQRALDAELGRVAMAAEG